MDPASPRFVIAAPGRDMLGDNARVLERHGLLRLYALATRRGSPGIPRERTALLPAFGLAAYIAARTVSLTRAEWFRLALHPWFDSWLRRKLRPGDYLISSYGYANASFQWVHAHGGKTFLDGGNSHPQHAWAILEEEHRRWGCAEPPMAPHHFRRAVAMLDHVDYVFAPSQFVARSFLQRGFAPNRVLRNVYVLDLERFTPSPHPRPADRPLTIISTGSLSLRKGTPYLLEAFRLVRRAVPDARLLLTRVIADNVQPILARYGDLPIEWSPNLSHEALAERLRGADLFVLPSLEEGLARTIGEALACGLPAIVTPNTGTAEYVTNGVSGTVVPIRDAAAIAQAILEWHPRIMAQSEPPVSLIDPENFSFAALDRKFIEELKGHDLIPASA